jgi:iron complex transport system substrate-binding protein
MSGLRAMPRSPLRLLALLALALCALPCLASRTVTDETGRTVTVPDHPHRIICLVPSITDSVFALGAADDVAAVSDYVRYPAEAMRKPSVGSISDPSVETVLALHPDLILTMAHWTKQESLDRFESLGIPVFLVDTHGLAGILRTIVSLGHATNRDTQAAALVARLQQRIDAVRASVAGKPAVRIFMPLSYDPIFTIGKGSFISEIIDAAGGYSITRDIPQEWPQVSMEAVIARNPQALLLMSEGTLTYAMLKKRPGWDTLPALRGGQIYYIDRSVELPSPVAIDALEYLAKQFHH